MGRRREGRRVGRSRQFDCGPMKGADLTAGQQTAMLADRYTQRAAVYDALWSPIIRPAGGRLISRLSLAAAQSVIEVGTGTGALQPAVPAAPPGAAPRGHDRPE